jgi:titin
MRKINSRLSFFRAGLAGAAVILALTIFLQSFGVSLPMVRAAVPIMVTSNADSGSGSLREAIGTANITGTVNTINFNIGSGLQTINLNSPLPAITKQLTIDATTQPGYAGTPLIEINGAGAGPNANGLEVKLNDHSIIKGLVINNFSGSGVFINGAAAANTTIQNCYIGTDASGATAKPNGKGVLISGAANTMVGEAGSVTTSNIISGNTTYGIDVAGPNVVNSQVFSNYIGVNVSGAALPNGSGGIRLTSATQAKIGNGVTSGRNIISGNSGYGIWLTNNETTNNLIMGNYIGTNPAGTAAVPNTSGIVLDSAGGNYIGEDGAVTRNIISGNTNSGILLLNGDATGNSITSNYIGLNASGTAAIPNTDGIRLENAPANTLGFNGPATRNVISGNSHSGILITGSLATGNNIQANYIGTDSSGTLALPNLDGVKISEAGNNLVGNTGSGEGNVISGNTNNGVYILTTGTGAANNKVEQNFIGINFDGTQAIPNNLGVRIEGAATNIVGGSLVGGYRNIISGNTTDGVLISGAGAGGNIVRGDYIGLDLTGKLALGNATGIEINGAPSNVLGGNDGNYRNFIAANSGNGILVQGSGATANEARNNQVGLKSDNTNLKNGGPAIRVFGGGQLIMFPNNRVRA